METRDSRPAISELPLDLFGEVDAPAPDPQPETPPSPPEPDIHCWSCAAPLTVGLSTCAHCGAQNTPIPIVTSTPPEEWPAAEPPAPTGSYASRLAFAFMYMTRDIIRGTARFIGMILHDIIDWSVSGHRSRDRWE